MYICTVVVHFILLKSLVINVVIFMKMPSLYYLINAGFSVIVFKELLSRDRMTKNVG